MNILEIKSIARNNGINPGKSSKVTLIRSIQRTEGNFDCYGTAYQGLCDQGACLWRGDCFELSTNPLSTKQPDTKQLDTKQLDTKQNGKSHTNGKSRGKRHSVRKTIA